MLFLIYIIGIFVFVAWDAYIGFGFEFPDLSNGPNEVLSAFFWPIALPICIVIAISIKFEAAKKHRLERKEERRKLRVATERELQSSLKELDNEFDEQKTNATQG